MTPLNDFWSFTALVLVEVWLYNLTDFRSNNTGHLSPLAVNTMNHNIPGMHIKSEPISPPRESTTPSNLHSLRPPSTGQGQLSPNHINHMHSSPSPNSHSLDYDGPLLKRSRIDHGWATWEFALCFILFVDFIMLVWPIIFWYIDLVKKMSLVNFVNVL